ncbi:MFS general substrate transporter [Hypoxylon trugodes]|uniref:MFS general substrate transporter n=1 Tax=Hypoxylon trugodes TaxID=326681 RepID=UPI00219C6C0A|nr:MFS general substrate transporter [Hypoxylon trugodes]KAI1390615.1 MFS general substrate transporter [Hypoxylon trugodes]
METPPVKLRTPDISTQESDTAAKLPTSEDMITSKQETNGDIDTILPTQDEENDSVIRWEQTPSSTLVDWDGPDDPQNPQNWSWNKKLWTTVLISICTFAVSFGSSVLASAITVLSKEYRIGPTVAALSITLYVLGFAAGPLVWGPASEYMGRYWPFMIGYIGFMCFTVGVACAQNSYTIMICRFMQGAWGVSAVTVTPGVIVDLWDARTRALATIVWSMTIIIGPTFGPIIGSFTVKNENLGWRWTMWFTLIMSAVSFVLVVATVGETWGPIVLQRKAARLRVETKNWAIHSKRDEVPVEPRALIRKYALKPLQMLVYEPILVAITLYNCLIYGIIYLTFEAYPYAFGTVRKWEPGVSSLPFLSLMVGYVVACIISIVIHLQVVDKKLAKGIQPTPEDQLPSMIVGSFCLVIGLFWFAWTSSPDITWVPQIIAGPFIGCGVSLVFNPCITYLIECYLADANSALAANTIIRSAVAAAFPLFATPMYANLGVPWATSLLGFLGVAFIPAPILFYLFGKNIRSWSKFASEI